MIAEEDFPPPLPEAHYRLKQPLDKNVTLRVGGNSRYHKCDVCGANVFTKWTENHFTCNGCKSRFTAL